MLSLLDYLELRALGYYILMLFSFFIKSEFVKYSLGLISILLLLVVICFFILLIIPRALEDYVKIYNWYINSDFFVIIEEKANVKFIFKLLLLPFYLFLTIFFFIINVSVKTSYELVIKLNILRCVNCNSFIDLQEGTVICHYCSSEITGPPSKSCPGCNFKPNSVRCPFCGYLNFIGLFGNNPSKKAQIKSKN